MKTVLTNRLITVKIKYDNKVKKYIITPVSFRIDDLPVFFIGNDYDVKVLMGIVALPKHFPIGNKEDLIKRFRKVTEDLSTDTDTKAGGYF